MTGPAERPDAIGGYEDWPAYMEANNAPGAGFQGSSPDARLLARALGVPAVKEHLDYTVHQEVEHDGVATSLLSWQTGFGPGTSAWLVRPAGASGPLPGILALHCHGGIKSHGADRLVALPGSLSALPDGGIMHDGGPASANPPGPVPPGLRTRLYGGRALATWLAQQGFAVLAHDAFMWGSRRFTLNPLPYRTARAVAGQEALWREAGVVPSPAERYNAAAAAHEETVAKAAALLGTTVAGTVAHDDLAAFQILAGLPGVDRDRLGCVGFSGGGGRALILAGLSPLVRSYVVTCMMTTFASLLPAYLDAHSWLLHSPGLRGLGEWPDIAVRSSAEAVLVQYALRDELFPEQGMRDAHQYLSEHLPGRYTGSFWNESHVFSPAMQDEAAGFLAARLAVRPALRPETDPLHAARTQATQTFNRSR